MDTKPRELYLLFRAYQGYESSQLKVTNKNGKPSPPVGFVTFTSRQDAEDCRKKLIGVVFDLELKQSIRLEFARTNTKVNRPKQPSPPVYNPTISGITPTSIDSAFLGAASVYDQLQALEQQQQILAANGMLNLQGLQGLPMLTGNNQQFLQTNQLVAATMTANAIQQQQQLLAGLMNGPGSANPPCSTLFIANIGTNPNEEEIRQLFKKSPGFCRLRLNNKGGAPVAFVEFANIMNASYALATLQGTMLQSSERGTGIRIEYAKTKMGEGSSSQQSLSSSSAQYY